MAKRNPPVYRTYKFTDKDPMIDKIRTIVGDAHLKYTEIHELSGVSTTTLYNWFLGSTKRPQFATLNAVAMTAGHRLDLVPTKMAKTQEQPRQGKRPRRKAGRRGGSSLANIVNSPTP